MGHMFVVGGLRLAMIKLCTKFEISMFTHCDDIKGDIQKLGWIGG